MSRRLLLVLGFLATACSGPDSAPFYPTPFVEDTLGVDPALGCSAASPVFDVPAAALDSILAARDTLGSPDARWATLSRAAPGGFSGLWLDRTGRVVLALTDTTARTSATAFVNAHPELSGGFIVADGPVQETRWSFAQLWAWDAYILDIYGSEPSVHSVDRDEVRNRIRIGLEHGAARDRLAARLRDRGIPCNLVVLTLVEPTAPHAPVPGHPR